MCFIELRFNVGEHTVHVYVIVLTCVGCACVYICACTSVHVGALVCVYKYLSSPQVCFVCHALTFLVFLKLCTCDDICSICWFNQHACVVQLWLRDLQSGSRAPVPSCLAGQTPPFSGGWRRGGRRWAGSRRRQTWRQSGPTWGLCRRNDSVSQVSLSWQKEWADITIRIRFMQVANTRNLMWSR